LHGSQTIVFFFFVSETKSHLHYLFGLEIMLLSLLSSGVTGVYHHAQPIYGLKWGLCETW
jgi:hypothetical protein